MNELRNVAERDQAAKEKLVKSNLRLVITMARKYINWGMPLADLVQEGNIGLMRQLKNMITGWDSVSAPMRAGGYGSQ